VLKRVKTRWWALVLGVVATAGLAVSLAVLAGGEGELIVTPYSDVIRFEAPGAASLQVQIYDLSGKLLWDSGVVSGGVVDWDRTDEYGERLAYGTYLYLVQGWDSTGALKLKKTGKLSLLPGDRVQLQTAPPSIPSNSPALPSRDITLQPLAYHYTDLFVSNTLGVGTDAPTQRLTVANGAIEATASGTAWGTFILRHTSGKDWRIQSRDTGQFVFCNATDGINVMSLVGSNVGIGTINPTHKLTVANGAIEATASGTAWGTFILRHSSGKDWRMQSRNTGEFVFYNATDGLNVMSLVGSNIGVNTTSPAGKLDIRNTANQPALRIAASSGTNLIEAYNTGSGSATGLIFRVERETGNVRADGAFYGAGFYSGSADVAEHINVSEPVEPGDVVEIDPEKPGYFRKARGAYSRLVAGVISSDPGVVLGSNSDPVEGEGDSRPVLALAGRVPVKATTENGPIRVGDLLVASSKPGYAMRCTDPASAVGAVIGKALEPLEEGEGMIMVQVTLR